MHFLSFNFPVCTEDIQIYVFNPDALLKLYVPIC